MELELKIKGTPCMIASMATSFDLRLKSRYKDDASMRFHVYDFREKVRPDTDYVEIMFIKLEPYHKGWITVVRTPENISLLTVLVDDEIWSELEPIWLLLYDELDKHGYLLKDHTGNLNEVRYIGEIEEEYAILFDKENMRKYYKYYSIDTAEEIIRNLNKAWGERRRFNARWGPGLLSRYSKKKPETISRYLGAFRKAGIDKIKGIPIPHTFKSRQ